MPQAQISEVEPERCWAGVPQAQGRRLRQRDAGPGRGWVWERLSQRDAGPECRMRKGGGCAREMLGRGEAGLGRG